MLFSIRALRCLSWTAVTLAGTAAMDPLEAGCPCRGGQASVVGPLAPTPDWGVSGPVASGPVGESYGPPAPGALPWTAAAPAIQPPPGTLGRTYQMKSRPVPATVHPRMGMIDVRVPNATKVIVHDMNEFRTQDLLEGFQDPEHPEMWHFSSEPLIPGLPHIYRIEAEFVGPNGVTTQERLVRLIMGRLIEVNF